MLTLWESGKVTEVTYSDRYIQNPAAVTLLSNLLKPVFEKNKNANHLTVSTLFKTRERNGNRTYHDWAKRDDFESCSQNWLSTELGVSVNMQIFDCNKFIPHHRKLIIKFESGKAIKIRFDQGVTYWNIRFERVRESYFDFDGSVDDQFDSMSEACKRAKVINGVQWATDVVVEVIDKI